MRLKEILAEVEAGRPSVSARQRRRGKKAVLRATVSAELWSQGLSVTLSCYEPETIPGLSRYRGWCQNQEFCRKRWENQELRKLGIDEDGYWRCSGFGQPYRVDCPCPRCNGKEGCEHFEFCAEKRIEYVVSENRGYWVGKAVVINNTLQLEFNSQLPMRSCTWCVMGANLLAPCPRCIRGPWYFAKTRKSGVGEAPPPNPDFDKDVKKPKEEDLIHREMLLRGKDLLSWRMTLSNIEQLLSEARAREITVDAEILGVLEKIKQEIERIEKAGYILPKIIHKVEQGRVIKSNLPRPKPIVNLVKSWIGELYRKEAEEAQRRKKQELTV